MPCRSRGTPKELKMGKVIGKGTSLGGRVAPLVKKIRFFGILYVLEREASELLKVSRSLKLLKALFFQLLLECF